MKFDLNRRQFLSATAAGIPALLVGCGTTESIAYDLVIHGGRVIDPANGLDQLLDIAILGGQVAEVRAGIPANSATQSLDATGKLVVPGLIDIHLHARDAEMPPAEILSTGVTTLVDAGSRGADNFDQLIEIASNAPNRMRMMLNIGRLGNNPDGRAEFLDNLDQADIGKARAAVEQHREWIVGMKARLSRGIARDQDKEVLRRAIEVAGSFDLPVMIHIGDTASPLPELLQMLRPGDIVTHMCAPNPNGILDDKGQVLPEVRAARDRGIRFDFANGLHEHWTWEVAEAAYAQGFPPDTITSDLTVAGRLEQVYDLPTVVSKWLRVGMPLSDAIACVTNNAAATFRELNPYGSLSVGAAADVTVLELTEGEFEFIDNYEAPRAATQKLVTRSTVYGGKVV